jgi:hypothetical protein
MSTSEGRLVVVRFTRSARGVIAAMAVVVAAASCSTSSVVRQGSQERTSRIEDVSSVAPSPESLRSTHIPQPLRQLERVDSVGNCAPVYKRGGAGMCIDNLPCRGFGVKDENGKVFCTCYGEVGGCIAGQRCDDQRLACVSEDLPRFERGLQP